MVRFATSIRSLQPERELMTRHLTTVLAIAIASSVCALPVLTHAATSPVRVMKCEPRSHPFDPSSDFSPAHYPAGGPYQGWHDAYGHPFRPQSVTRETPILAIDYTNQSSK